MDCMNLKSILYFKRSLTPGENGYGGIWGNFLLPIWVQCTALTTVGYGDYVPYTFLGKLFMVCCIILGPAFVSFSVVSLVNFS